MKNSFKYFNNFVEKIHDKTPTPSKSPLKVLNGGVDSKVSTLANTASLEERIKAGSFQNKMMSQLGLKDGNQNQNILVFKNNQEINRINNIHGDRYDEPFKLKKELLEYKEKEKRYIGKISDLERENARLLDLIRQNEREFNEKIMQKQFEKQEILKKYNELKMNLEQSQLKNEKVYFCDEKNEDDTLLLGKIIAELTNKMLEIEKNALIMIKEKKSGKENINTNDESLMKTNENWMRKCKEMEFISFHLHNENKHLKQYINSFSDHSKEKSENIDVGENNSLPLPSSLKILEIAKKVK